ncbi:MAG: hypothetical protein ACYCX4_10495 [Bacillota bacterium]
MLKIFKERAIRAFVCGVISGVVIDIYSSLNKAITGLIKLSFIDWMALMIYGDFAKNFWERLFAFGSHLIFTGLIGIAFAYFIRRVTSSGYYFKGWLYGVSTWMIIYAVSVIYRVNGTIPIYLDTALSNFIGASIYGLVLAGLLLWFDNRV